MEEETDAVLFHRHADGGHRCAVHPSDQPGGKVVDPHPRLVLFPGRQGDPQMLGVVVVIRMEAEPADILHPLPGAADLAVQGAFLVVAGVAEAFRGGHLVHRDHLRRERLAEHHRFRFKKRAFHFLHLRTPFPLSFPFPTVQPPKTAYACPCRVLTAAMTVRTMNAIAMIRYPIFPTSLRGVHFPRTSLPQWLCQSRYPPARGA